MTEAYYGLPATVRFCRRCVISNQRPSSTVEFRNTADTPKETIFFDEEGICAACRYQDIKDREIDWAAREQALRDLCREYRSKAGNYDCVVPGSGGKDSTFTAHVLKHRFGMNPLTVTWAPHIYTDVGFRNLHKWIDSGLDNILFTPNGKVHRLLTRLAFENLVHPFQPFIVGQRHIAPKMSAAHGIPLVFYGENQAEYGNDIQENFRATMKPEFYCAERDLSAVSLGGVPADELVRSFGVDGRELEPYLPAEPARLQEVGTTVHYLGYYLKWDPQECYYYAVEHTGFSVNDERTEGSYSKYSSIDDRIDPLHYYTTLIKFGIGRATYDASQEIRTRKISREEGVALVKRYDDEFPHKYFREVIDYMGISESRFFEVIDRARSPHLWRQADGKWQLRHAVWMETVSEAGHAGV
jgi:N-acetyl sugar amidotransferase